MGEGRQAGAALQAGMGASACPPPSCPLPWSGPGSWRPFRAAAQSAGLIGHSWYTQRGQTILYIDHHMCSKQVPTMSHSSGCRWGLPKATSQIPPIPCQAFTSIPGAGCSCPAQPQQKASASSRDGVCLSYPQVALCPWGCVGTAALSHITGRRWLCGSVQSNTVIHTLQLPSNLLVTPVAQYPQWAQRHTL